MTNYAALGIACALCIFLFAVMCSSAVSHLKQKKASESDTDEKK